jgi:Sec-independent protein secretion pathway component TatC
MIWCLISSITLFLVSYHHQEELVCLWIYCDNITKMQYLNIADGFQTWLSMHFYWSLLWSLPVFLYQLSQFLKPGLHRAEWVNIILFGCWGTLIVLITSGFLFTNYLWQHIVEVFFSFGSQLNLSPIFSTIYLFIERRPLPLQCLRLCLGFLFCL